MSAHPYITTEPPATPATAFDGDAFHAPIAAAAATEIGADNKDAADQFPGFGAVLVPVCAALAGVIAWALTAGALL